MGQVGISITKRTVFRDSTQHFSNTYHYAAFALNPSQASAEEMIDEIVAIEKVFHSVGVTFVHARCWSSGGSIEENQMIFEKELTGTGASLAPVNGLDKERAVLAQWPAGRDSRGRRVYLRKWYHPCGNFGATGYSTAIMANETGFTTAARAAMAALVEPLDVVGVLLNWELVAESGREIDDLGAPPQIHPYLEHHQLGDEWRA